MINMDVRIPVERWQHFDLGKTTDLLLAEHPFMRFDKSVLFTLAEYLDYDFNQYVRDYLKRNQCVTLQANFMFEDKLLDILTQDLQIQLATFVQEQPEYENTTIEELIEELFYLLNGVVAIAIHHEIQVNRIVAVEFENPGTVAFVIRKPKEYIESMRQLEHMLHGLRS